MTNATIIEIAGDDPRLEALATAARGEGYAHIDRLIAHWCDGTNRFDGAGEELLAAALGGQIVAVGGLNRDPYLDDPRVGRVRHLYVLPSARRIGVGRRLVDELIRRARGRFAVVRVRAAKGDAPRFYDAIGCQRVEEPAASHIVRP